jgi:hypothetical protein
MVQCKRKACALVSLKNSAYCFEHYPERVARAMVEKSTPGYTTRLTTYSPTDNITITNPNGAAASVSVTFYGM